MIRSSQVYAHSDGQSALHLGDSQSLDPDDCLAQMIFHELCHAMVESYESLKQPDWGLDNTSAKDLVHEHACLRLQAKLAGPHGLRGYLAATTVFRKYYDQLPEDPLFAETPREQKAVAMAQRGYERSQNAPFAPHIERALKTSAKIVELTRAFVDLPQDSLPSLTELFER